MPNEVSLLEMLDARERRVQHQQALLAQYHKPLICFTMNIAAGIPLPDTSAMRNANRSSPTK
mgnify:CR=1 FL=1